LESKARQLCASKRDGDGVAMMNSTLRRRLGKLELHFQPREKPLRFAIRFVEPGGRITETLFVEPGRENRWMSGDPSASEVWDADQGR